MIDPEELRIGNYLNVIGITPVKITAAHILAISLGDSQYSPIPLTDEWLVNMGFNKRSPEGYWYDLNRISINIPTIEYKNNWIEINLQYVHQLQNLYFALTGEELKYQL